MWLLAAVSKETWRSPEFRINVVVSDYCPAKRVSIETHETPLELNGTVEFIRNRKNLGKQANESELEVVQKNESPKISVTEVKIDRVSQYTA